MIFDSIFGGIFANKTVIITGHTGFKGSWLSEWLLQLGARVVGIALDPHTNPSHFSSLKLVERIEDIRQDLRDRAAVENIVSKVQPDFVFHLAAQALVSKGYTCPYQTWTTNVIGSLNILEGLRTLKKRCIVVMITSDKCYENKEWTWGYREVDSLGGKDPYSASKAAAELLIASHTKSFFLHGELIRTASARAGNVIGGGDWADGRIVPDCIKAWQRKESVALRNPDATRPWQHVLEPLSGYLHLAMELSMSAAYHGEPFNFGPSTFQNKSVADLVNLMRLEWGGVSWEKPTQHVSSMPEAGLLKLNCDKALHLLNWSPTLNFEETIRMTTKWYKEYYQSSCVADLSISQLHEYTSIAKQRGIAWTR